MTELKPCPFCHYQNRLKKVHIISRRLPFWWFIECDNCHCCGETKLFLRRAVKSWNRRAETVKAQPAADVVEVRHGKWIEDHEFFKGSECGYLTDYRLSNFCPDCGAKMDGKVGDDNGSMESVRR